MARMTREEFMEYLFHEDYDKLKGRTLRLTRERIPGREVCLAHIMNPMDTCIYQDLSLHIGVHEGEDHTGEAIGMIRLTPWETTIVAADVAMKSANVDLGFMDRFNGTVILTGRLDEVKTAVEEVIRFFREELHFPVCEITEN